MKPLSSNTIFYEFKSDNTLIYFKLKAAGKLLNLTGSSKFFEVPVSYIHQAKVKDAGYRYVIDLKVNRFNFNQSEKKFRHMRFFLLKGVEEQGKVNEFFKMLEDRSSIDLWQEPQIESFKAASA